jgi:peptidoglycan/xylan/chitin deacetylase (PgdA/CDA1 family)
MTRSRILANTRPGGIILVHDIHPSSIDAMPGTLDGLLAKGFRFVTVSDLIAMGNRSKPGTSSPIVQAPPPPITFSPGSF